MAAAFSAGVPPRSDAVGDRAHELRRKDADHLGTRARGIRQRAEQVEHRSRCELAPDGRRVLHRRVVRRSEEEREAELVDRLLDLLAWQLELEAERLEDVGGAGARRHGAVAVLRDRGARGRGDERGGRRDVQRVRVVAAGARGVDEVLALRLDCEHVRAHRLRAAGDLVSGLSLRAQRDEEAADLRRRRIPGHDHRHDLARLCTLEVVAVEQPRDRVLDHRRKFRSRSIPSGVSTDSGWNCTPSIGSVRCLTPMTSPSSARAEISSSSGTVVAASEW